MNSQQKIQKWKSFTFTHQNDNIYLIQPTISLEMPVPSQGHYVFTVFRLLTDFVCLYTYEF
jgi:hypothetical protein